MKKQTEKRIRVLGTILFLAYLALLVYLLFFAERYGRGADAVTNLLRELIHRGDGRRDARRHPPPGL